MFPGIFGGWPYTVETMQSYAILLWVCWRDGMETHVRKDKIPPDFTPEEWKEFKRRYKEAHGYPREVDKNEKT